MTVAPAHPRPPRRAGTALLLAGWVLAGAAVAQEFRGLWVDAWKPGLKSHAEILQLVAEAHRGRFNALIVQARRRGDALYQSRYEPRIGGLPADYDPLADLLEQAHQGTPRLEVHAWIVTYPIWNSQTPPADPTHALNRHPEWLSKNDVGTTWDGDNFNLDPGHPGVQQHVFDVAMDLIGRYDLDGFHFDYVRYPGRAWGYNDVAVARFNARYGRAGRPAPTDLAWMQWRRDQVTALVRKVYLHARATKPHVKISAATIAWAPGILGDSEWINTSAFSNVLQDWRAWMQEGILDLNLPMAYFRQTTHASDWAAWSEFIKNHRYRRHAALGTGLYLNSLSNALVQLRSTRLPTRTGQRADGLVGYSYAVPCTDATRTAFLEALTQRSGSDPEPAPLFADAAAPPDMPWKTAPTLGHLQGFVRHGLTGEVLDAARVRLTGPATRTQWTDPTGFFGWVDLAPDTYTLEVGAPQLETWTTPVTLTAGRVSALDLALFPEVGDRFLADLGVVAGGREAIVAWHTDEPAAARVEYGLATNEVFAAIDPFGPATHHAILLGGLTGNTNYRFRIVTTAGTNELRSSWRDFRTSSADATPPGELPLWWAQHFFGAPTDATADPDADGYSNFMEYLLGTHPRRATSRLALRLEPAAAAAAAHSWQLAFAPVLAGRTYTVLTADTPADGVWTPLSLAPPVVAADGWGILPLPAAPVGDRFFRLRIQVNP